MTNSTKCCDGCFLPERDSDTFHSHAAGYALPQGCKDQECPCHSTPDKESEMHPLTGLLVKATDEAFAEPTESDVVARFREMVKEHVGEGADIMVYPNEIVFSQQRIEQFILGEIQAAREEERERLEYNLENTAWAKAFGAMEREEGAKAERTKWRGVIEDQTELWEEVGLIVRKYYGYRDIFNNEEATVQASIDELTDFIRDLLEKEREKTDVVVLKAAGMSKNATLKWCLEHSREEIEAALRTDLTRTDKE